MKNVSKPVIIDFVLFLFLLAVLGIHFSRLLPTNVDSELMLISGLVGVTPVFLSATKSLIKKYISMDLLASVALVFSLFARQWTSAIFIALMLTAARIFQDWSDNRARRSIKNLLKLRPESVKVERSGKLSEISLRDVKIGDVVVVEMGRRIAIDGVVVSGEGSVDESSLTGESLPVAKETGNKVYSSTLLSSGHLHVKTEKIGKDTTLEQIIDLVESSQANKPKFSTLGEMFGRIYLILVSIGSIALYYFTHNLSLVLSVVLVVCADDVAVAVPLTFLTAVGFAAKNGVIVKGNNYLEAISKTKVVLMDKTGTLTKGVPHVEKIGLFGDSKLDLILTAAGAISQESDHPISKAITKYVKSHDINFSETEQSQEISGRGIKATWQGKEVLLGRPAFLKEKSVKITMADQVEMKAAEEEGFSISMIAIDSTAVGFFGIADEVKRNSRLAIEELRSLGVEKVVMITGDNEKVAKKVALDVGVDEYHANVLPEEKVNVVKKYLKKGLVTVMVGDGINDAAALSIADVGVAMGKRGLDAAIESADVIMMRDDLTKIPFLIRLSRRVHIISMQDFWIWGVTNMVGLSLALTGVVGPSGAAAYNFITDFFPLLNTFSVFGVFNRKQTR